jgi:hypothetical protein
MPTDLLRTGDSVFLRYPNTGNSAYAVGDHQGKVSNVDINGIAWIEFGWDLESLDVSADGRSYVSTDPSYGDINIDVQIVDYPPVSFEPWSSKSGTALRREGGDRPPLPQLKPGQLVMLVYPDAGSDAYVPGRYYGRVRAIGDEGIVRIVDYDFLRSTEEPRAYFSVVYGVEITMPAR